MNPFGCGATSSAPNTPADCGVDIEVSAILFFIDEVFVKIQGKQQYLWRAVDQEQHDVRNKEIHHIEGYDLFPAPTTLPQHLLAKRRGMGWSIKEAASVVGVNPTTWGNWERGQMILYRQHRTRVARLLDLSTDAIDQEMGGVELRRTDF